LYIQPWTSNHQQTPTLDSSVFNAASGDEISPSHGSIGTQSSLRGRLEYLEAYHACPSQRGRRPSSPRALRSHRQLHPVEQWRGVCSTHAPFARPSHHLWIERLLASMLGVSIVQPPRTVWTCSSASSRVLSRPTNEQQQLAMRRTEAEARVLLNPRMLAASAKKREGLVDMSLLRRN
jgi:hypothetical protein